MHSYITCLSFEAHHKNLNADTVRYPYCQRRKCSPVNVVSSDIRVMQIFAGVREIWGVKQENGHLRCQFSYLSLAIFSESSSPRLKLLYFNRLSVIGISFTRKWVTLDDLELL